MRGPPVLVVCIALAITGCLAGSNDPSPSVPTTPTIEITETRPDPTFANVTVGPTAAPDLNATLAAPPKLIKGEWWRVQLESPLTGDKTEFIRVLADVQGDDYVFGMPHEGWWKEGVIYHTPAFGDVDAKDLSYKVHDVLFTPLKFPLTDGQTWETKWEGGATLKATVKTEGDKLAHITFVNPSGGGLNPLNQGKPQKVLELTYDAAQHEVVEFKHSTVTFKVVEHGYNFQGWVTVPRAEKLVFFHGRVGNAVDANFQPSPAPVEQVEIKGGYNRLSFILMTQAVAPAPTCKETAVAPNGKTYELAQTPCTDLTIQFFEHQNPDGVWNLTHLAPGGTLAFIEGIAYHQYDIRLPDGAIRSDHSHPVIR